MSSLWDFFQSNLTHFHSYCFIFRCWQSNVSNYQLKFTLQFYKIEWVKICHSSNRLYQGFAEKIFLGIYLHSKAENQKGNWGGGGVLVCIPVSNGAMKLTFLHLIRLLSNLLYILLYSLMTIYMYFVLFYPK